MRKSERKRERGVRERGEGGREERERGGREKVREGREKGERRERDREKQHTSLFRCLAHEDIQVASAQSQEGVEGVRQPREGVNVWHA